MARSSALVERMVSFILTECSLSRPKPSRHFLKARRVSSFSSPVRSKRVRSVARTPQSLERRVSILDGAGRVFARDGYEGASMTQIAQESGVSKGTLYNYFPSKVALFTGFISTSCDHSPKHSFDFANDEDDPKETLQRAGTAALDMMLSPFRQAVYRMVIAEADQFPDLARAFFETGPKHLLESLARWLKHETSVGRLFVPDPDLAAEQFFVLCQTKLVMRARLRLIGAPDPAEIERVLQGAVSLFLKAYGPFRPSGVAGSAD
jgi:TetR/AcrR family transcriptional regulator, mexJK operon transcriptional repressor